MKLTRIREALRTGKKKPAPDQGAGFRDDASSVVLPALAILHIVFGSVAEQIREGACQGIDRTIHRIV